MWLINQIAMLLYMFTLHDTLVKVMSVLWTSLYVVMLALIIHYRRNPGNETTVPLEAAVTE